MADVFISYKREERERVQLFADALSALGLTVWLDARLSPGDSFSKEITRELEMCRATLVCWSTAALNSEWVRGEAEIARRRGTIVPVSVEDCDLPPPFNMLHTENLRYWNGNPADEAWQRVLVRIGSLLARPGLPELAVLFRDGTPQTWSMWVEKYPDDSAVQLARSLAGSRNDDTLDAPPTDNELGQMTASELLKASEAADFRLRIYRDAARRFGWEDRPEERRLEKAATDLRAALDRHGVRPSPDLIERAEATLRRWRARTPNVLRLPTAAKVLFVVTAVSALLLYSAVVLVPLLWRGTDTGLEAEHLDELQSRTDALRSIVRSPRGSADGPASAAETAPPTQRRLEAPTGLPTGDVDRADVESRILALLGGQPPLDHRDVDDSIEAMAEVNWCTSRIATFMRVSMVEAQRIADAALANAASDQGVAFIQSLEHAARGTSATTRNIAVCASELFYALPE